MPVNRPTKLVRISNVVCGQTAQRILTNTQPVRPMPTRLELSRVELNLI